MLQVDLLRGRTMIVPPQPKPFCLLRPRKPPFIKWIPQSSHAGDCKQVCPSTHALKPLHARAESLEDLWPQHHGPTRKQFTDAGHLNVTTTGIHFCADIPTTTSTDLNLQQPYCRNPNHHQYYSLATLACMSYGMHFVPVLSH